MAKEPKNTPALGDRVEYRKTGVKGVLAQVNSNNWCRVRWDAAGPSVCHLFELVKGSPNA